MQLRFLGTGTSMGVPVIGCECAVCTSPDPRNRRTRTSALLRSGDQTILIDAGPDFRAQALAAALRAIDAVLLTHSHFDHVAGLDDLRPLCHRTGSVPVYGSERTLAEVRERFAYAFQETSVGSTRPSLDLRVVERPFTVGDTRISPLDILHGTWTITGYRIGGLGYVTDASAIPSAAWGQLGGLDVLVLNALRQEPHPTHYSIDQALEVIAALRPRRAFLVHMTHSIEHAAHGATLPPGVEFAYDGLTVEVADQYMLIGIDARLNAYRQGGIAQYTRQLLAALAAEAPRQQFVALQHHSQARPLVLAPNVRRAAMFTPPHNRFEQWSLPLELLPQRLGLLHCPDFIAPLRRPCPAVVTIHDLAFLHFPAILDADARRFYGQVRAAAHNADAVITVSASTRADIAALLDLPPERVDVIYEAADERFAPTLVTGDEQRVIGGKGLRAGAFLLFMSTIEPRKNLETLLRALRVCLDREPGAGYQLVAAGARGWLDEPIYALVRELRLDDAVLFLGKVELEDQLWLYNACRLYLNPSLYEGFGLPALEALACGAPTVVADTSSLPEVVGDAALCLPPRDVGAWAEAIGDLWDDEGARAELARRGPAQAAQFSWRRAARETLAVYRRVAGPTGV